MANEEKSVYTTGSFMSDTFMDPPSIEYIPDPVDYSFLIDNQGFSIGAHSKRLMKFLTYIEKSYIYDFNVFNREAAVVVADKLCEATGIPKYKKVLFVDSIFPRFASRDADKPLVFDIASLIAGNIDIIKMDQIIEHGYDMRWPAWIPMTVYDVRDDLEKPMNKKLFFSADSGILTGSRIVKYMSSKFIKFILRQIGMPRRTPSTPRDIFGTKMSILMVKQGSSIEMTEFETSSSQESYNKQLFKIRYGDRPCHMGMTNTCEECIYGLDKCDFAVYKKTE